MTALAADTLERANRALATVCDPEIPVLTLADLGIVREVALEGARVVVKLTPTYTGCPATEVICEDVRRALTDAGLVDAEVRMVLTPAWTTDWISEAGRRKLRDYGIAPPAPVAGCHTTPPQTAVIRWMPRREPAADTSPRCPRCDAPQVERLSEFGSTACKSLWRCLACREPFDYFKPY